MPIKIARKFCFLVLLLFTQLVVASDPIDIKYTSYKPTLRELLTGNYKKQPTEFVGKLYLPLGDGPFPALMWVHGTGGVDGYYTSGWINRLLNITVKRGVALYVIDNYTARGINGFDATMGRVNLSMSVRLIDAFSAGRALANELRIDSRRVFVSGHSAGGLVAINSASVDVIRAVNAMEFSFAGHIAISPECLTQPKGLKFDERPMLIISGEKDIQTPVEHCRKLIAAMPANYPADLKVIANGYHNITNMSQSTLNMLSYRECGRWVFDENGGYTLPDKGNVNNGEGISEFNRVVNACKAFLPTVESGSEKIVGEVASLMADYIDRLILKK